MVVVVLVGGAVPWTAMVVVMGASEDVVDAATVDEGRLDVDVVGPGPP